MALGFPGTQRCQHPHAPFALRGSFCRRVLGPPSNVPSLQSTHLGHFKQQPKKGSEAMAQALGAASLLLA